jgi:hypothetical protein
LLPYYLPGTRRLGLASGNSLICAARITPTTRDAFRSRGTRISAADMRPARAGREPFALTGRRPRARPPTTIPSRHAALPASRLACSGRQTLLSSLCVSATPAPAGLSAPAAPTHGANSAGQPAGRRDALPYLVIEYNPFLVDELRARHVPVIYGDAANPAVLDPARLESARLMAVLVPDARAAELAMRHGHHAHPDLNISAGDLQQIERLPRARAPSGPTRIRDGGRSPPPYPAPVRHPGAGTASPERSAPGRLLSGGAGRPGPLAGTKEEDASWKESRRLWASW